MRLRKTNNRERTNKMTSRKICCKCRVIKPQKDMIKTTGCLGQAVWLCNDCVEEHHKETIKQILVDVEKQGYNIEQWRYLLKK